MKLRDYRISLIKSEIGNMIDSHDTLYGAFCKGIGFAETQRWIPAPDKKPEEFEDLIDTENTTKSVLVMYESGMHSFRIRQRDGKTWEWAPKEREGDKIIKWTNV